MAEKFISERNLKFLLYEMFDVESLLKYPRYADHSREVFDMVIDTAMKMGKDLFKPIFSEMDKNPPEYVKGQVKVHPAVRNIMREAGAGGWIGSTFDCEYGGLSRSAHRSRWSDRVFQYAGNERNLSS